VLGITRQLSLHWLRQGDDGFERAACAWANGSRWARVIAALEEKAMKVSAAPLPLTFLADDVTALNRSLDRTKGPIVLLGHAYAGTVITLARHERVKVAQSQPNCGPNAPADDTYGVPFSGSAAGREGARRCQNIETHNGRYGWRGLGAYYYQH
jgi:hypothetical protein